MNLSTLISNYEQQGSPFATHINLLRVLGPGIKIALELGTGLHSTPLFLDKQYYPDLTELISIESDAAWAKETQTGDERHTIHIVEEPIELYLSTLPLQKFDLIFCDNSASGERRCETLRWLAENVGRSLVVAHDFNVPSYREACSGFDHFIVDDRQSPHTALMWRSR